MRFWIFVLILIVIGLLYSNVISIPEGKLTEIPYDFQSRVENRLDMYVLTFWISCILLTLTAFQFLIVPKG